MRYRFQFLIGTLKTKQLQTKTLLSIYVSIPDRYAKNGQAWEIKLEFEDGFQFLIGTLKTRGKKTEEPKKEEFQFLIGTLKTASHVHAIFL